MRIIFGLLIFLFFSGCIKNQTKFYEDVDSNGLSIFSNTGNNLLSAYFKNKVWQTKDRISYTTGSIYEITISKFHYGLSPDSLLISWTGKSEDNRDYQYQVLQLFIAVPSNTDFTYFKNYLEGKRIVIDSTKGYFKTYNNYSFPRVNAKKGMGLIYFNKAYIDTTIRFNDTLYTGKISGLLEAKFDSIEFKNGRFDHNLENGQLNIK
jgi:hypothetical protein